MPIVDLRTNLGCIPFSYTISTPTEASAQGIDPSLPTVLFMHPGYFPSEAFHPQFSDASLRGSCNLIAMDSRGLGQSHAVTGETYGQHEAAEDLYQFITALKLPPLFIAAVDMGTITAIQLGVLRPGLLLGLFLVSQLGPPEPPEVTLGREEVCQAFLRGITGDLESQEEGAIGAHQLAYNNKYIELTTALLAVSFARVYALWMQHPNPSGSHRLLVDFYAEREAYTSTQLSNLRDVPIFIVHGASDVAYPIDYAEGFVNSLKEAGVSMVELKIVEDGPHYLSITHPEQINKWIYDFVRKHAPSSYKLTKATATTFDSPFEEVLLAAGLPNGCPETEDDGLDMDEPGKAEHFEM